LLRWHPRRRLGGFRGWRLLLDGRRAIGRDRVGRDGRTDPAFTVPVALGGGVGRVFVPAGGQRTHGQTIARAVPATFCRGGRRPGGPRGQPGHRRYGGRYATLTVVTSSRAAPAPVRWLRRGP